MEFVVPGSEFSGVIGLYPRNDSCERLKPSRVFADRLFVTCRPAKTFPKMRSLVLRSNWRCHAYPRGLLLFPRLPAFQEAKRRPTSYTGRMGCDRIFLPRMPSSPPSAPANPPKFSSRDTLII